jgi:hypothetical protein
VPTPPPPRVPPQWHVVDYNLFTPGQPLPPHTLTVVEQMPGPFTTLNDQTPVLAAQGYWVSYNRIRTPWLFDVANQTALVAAFGDHYSYNLTARARIFARDALTVVDEASLVALMRYNSFQSDPLSVQGCADNVPSASNAIAERGDLTNPNASCIEQVAFQVRPAAPPHPAAHVPHPPPPHPPDRTRLRWTASTPPRRCWRRAHWRPWRSRAPRPCSRRRSSGARRGR